jgi:diguanylate cyclase (GGDEF)-like protein
MTVLQWQPLMVPPVIGAVICLLGARLALPRLKVTRASAALLLMLCGFVEWALVQALGYSIDNLGLQTGFALAIYPGVCSVVLGFFYLARLMADPAAALPHRRTMLALCVEPVAITVLAATNPWHHLVIQSAMLVGHPALLSYRPGPAFWVHSGYCYLVLGSAFLRIGLAWRNSSQLQRRQLRMLLFGVVFPIAANSIYLLSLMQHKSVDFTVEGFLATGIIWVLFGGLLHKVPVARAMVFERLTDAVAVIDAESVVIDLNPAAVGLARRIRGHADGPAEFGDKSSAQGTTVGVPFTELFPFTDSADALQDGHYSLLEGSELLSFDVRVSPLTDPRGAAIAWAVVIRDVTAVVRANQRTLELSEQLAELAVRDELTGLHNRRHLMAALDSALASPDGVGVVLLDIDHFKSVNDRFGHPVGDDVLVAVARLLQTGSRGSDTVARYGGEEFVLLLPGATVNQTVRRAEQIRAACDSMRVRHDSGTIEVSISAGVAAAPQTGSTASGLLRAADAALYRAKEGGRNQVQAALDPHDRKAAVSEPLTA